MVWGYAPQLYVEFDWTPASRYVASMLLLPWGRQSDYRTTLIKEITNDPPRCIIDIIGSDLNGISLPTDTLTSLVPGLVPLLKACYQLSSDIPPGPQAVALWIRRQTAGCTKAATAGNNEIINDRTAFRRTIADA